MQSSTTYVFLAGIGNSGPDHWQTKWYQRIPNGVWVEHESWDTPVRDAWVTDLDRAMKRIEGRKVLIAHSLGCTLVTEWAGACGDVTVAGALLVAVPDVHGANFPTEAVGFGASKLGRLPFRTVVVCSEDDAYGSWEHSVGVADRLGADLVNVGNKGHINAASGLDDWPEGWSILTRQLDSW